MYNQKTGDMSLALRQILSSTQDLLVTFAIMGVQVLCPGFYGMAWLKVGSGRLTWMLGS